MHKLLSTGTRLMNSYMILGNTSALLLEDWGGMFMQVSRRCHFSDVRWRSKCHRVNYNIKHFKSTLNFKGLCFKVNNSQTIGLCYIGPCIIQQRVFKCIGDLLWRTIQEYWMHFVHDIYSCTFPWKTLVCNSPNTAFEVFRHSFLDRTNGWIIR